VQLLDEGATVPFVARYRKEVTGGLDDTQLRNLEERLGYLRELEERRAAVINSIAEQGKLDPALREAIENAETKQRLEDLYLPYKQKRRTKAQIAREAGIQPLADALLADPTLTPEAEAAAYLKADAGFADTKAVLDGARQILMERFAEDAELLGKLREYLNDHGVVASTVITDKETDPAAAKFRDWFDFREAIGTVPSHRALALFRGRNEGFLRLQLALDSDPTDGSPAGPNPCEGRIAGHFGIKDQGRPADAWLRETVRWAWSVKISLHLELELLGQLREKAEEEAIRVFGRNLKDLLLAAPAGPRATLGLDPGLRTGVKVAVVDQTGKLVDTATIYPHEPRRDWDGSLHTLARLCAQHGVQLIAIGNGTASRETDKLAGDLIKLLEKTAAANHMPKPKIQKVVISEAGASVYSASEYASQELPDVDVSLRGAASIARRLQDPLAELVKIDPKSIGVGQYQHDVNQGELARTLDAMVEDCVNGVGVDLNTASVPLLSRVSGLSGTVAKAIVKWREAHGAFANRQQLLKVTGLGPKTFEQSAGFLRIRGGDNPLDMTGVHPETYPVVQQIIVKAGKPVDQIMGRTDVLKSLKPELFANEQFGIITVKDILQELEKPGRDPRPDFAVARFNEGVEDIADLREGMMLEGTVSNVAQFGAFVDLGVHQDGLVHVSQLSNKFVNDAREVVKTGQIVKVKVLEVDVPRKRISLSMKLDAPTGVQHKSGESRGNHFESAGRGRSSYGSQNKNQAQQPTAIASAFEKLKGLR
jgi:uncharacterized protein